MYLKRTDTTPLKELHSHRLYALSRIGHKIPAIENLGIAKVS